MKLALPNRIYKDEGISIPKGIEQKIIQHKHYRAFTVFLQLKPLYISGMIMNDGGKYPYAQMATYLGISVSGLRGKVRQLKKYKLLRTDKDKNIHLASYKIFVSLFRPQFLRRMKKYHYRNVASADQLIRTACMHGNFRTQAYIIKNKIINKEIYGTVNAQKDRIKQPEGISPSFPVKNDCPRNMSGTDLSKTAIRKIRKLLVKDYDNLLHKQKRIYLEQLEQVEQNGLPEINPHITLSCAGVGRLFGNTSSGYYQRQNLIKAGLVSISERGMAHKINPVSPDGQEELLRQGVNVFSYNYPVKKGMRGKEEKFFIHLPDRLDLNFNFIYAKEPFMDESAKFRSIIDDVLKKHETKN